MSAIDADFALLAVEDIQREYAFLHDTEFTSDFM